MLIIIGINGYKEKLYNNVNSDGNTIQLFTSENLYDDAKKDIFKDILTGSKVNCCDVVLDREMTIAYRLGADFTAYGIAFSNKENEVILRTELGKEYKKGDSYDFQGTVYKIVGFIANSKFNYVNSLAYRHAELFYGAEIVYKNVLTYEQYRAEERFLQSVLGENIYTNIQQLPMSEYIVTLGVSLNNVFMIVFAIVSLVVILRLYFINISKIYACFRTVGFSKIKTLSLAATDAAALGFMSFVLSVAFYFIFIVIQGIKHQYLDFGNILLIFIACNVLIVTLYVIFVAFFTNKKPMIKRKKVTSNK